MDDATRGERLGPELISAAYPPVRFAPRVAEVLFGGLLSCVTYAIAWSVSSPPSNVTVCLMIAIFVGAIGGLRSNGRRLLWLWCDTLGRPRATGSVLGFVPPDLAEGSKCVPASGIEPGDWVCDYDAHQRDLRNYEEALERHARSPVGNWDESSGEAISSFSEPDYGDAQHLPSLPEPVMSFSQVLAVLPVKDGMYIHLGLAGADPIRVDPNRPYYRREAVTSGPAPQPSRSSAAIEKLVGMLPRDRTAVPERDLILDLTRVGYDEPTIWNAFRACRAIGLISLNHAFGWAAEAFLGIFRLRASASGHHRCHIALTELGRIWACTADPRRSTTPARWEVVMGDKVAGDKVAGDKVAGDKVAGDKVTGDKYEFGNAAVVGPGARTRSVRFTGAPSQSTVGDTLVLASQLVQVLAVLEARSNGTGPQLAAIEAVRSAATAAKADDAIQVMTHLSRAGKWALETATSIGAAVATAAIERAIGL
jgi:hypothetical protein